jgi:hypothetical protein
MAEIAANGAADLGYFIGFMQFVNLITRLQKSKTTKALKRHR